MRMTSVEFAEWIAYHRIYPFGEDTENRRAGTIAAAIANLFRKRGAKAVSWDQYFPPYQRRKPGANWENMLETVKALNTRLGGTDKRKTPAE